MLAIVGTPHSVQCRQMSANVDMATFGDIWRHLATFVDIRGDMRPLNISQIFKVCLFISFCFQINQALPRIIIKI